MDQDQFNDFLQAQGPALGEALTAESREFFNRLVVAQRTWKAAFGHISEEGPGELQGTLMMMKMQLDTSA
jgi:hypothetical protein